LEPLEVGGDLGCQWDGDVRAGSGRSRRGIGEGSERGRDRRGEGIGEESELKWDWIGSKDGGWSWVG
jgi:hypothetical protein